MKEAIQVAAIRSRSYIERVEQPLVGSPPRWQQGLALVQVLQMCAAVLRSSPLDCQGDGAHSFISCRTVLQKYEEPVHSSNEACIRSVSTPLQIYFEAPPSLLASALKGLDYIGGTFLNRNLLVSFYMHIELRCPRTPTNAFKCP